MKTMLPVCLVLFLLIYACEENPEIPEEPEPLDLAGEYVGSAEIHCKEYRFYFNSTRVDTIVFREETFQDKFIVANINLEDSVFKIQRLSYAIEVNGAICNSQYDIGNPNGEYDLGENLRWGYKYKYDSDWDSWIQFNPDNTLTGYMLQKGLFTLREIDSDGKEYEYVRFFEYEITASRQ